MDVCAVSSHTPEKKTAVEAVSKKGVPWAHQVQDPGQQGQADGACLPRQGGPHLHQYGAQGDHCQRRIHHQRPQSVLKRIKHSR